MQRSAGTTFHAHSRGCCVPAGTSLARWLASRQREGCADEFTARTESTLTRVGLAPETRTLCAASALQHTGCRSAVLWRSSTPSTT